VILASLDQIRARWQDHRPALWWLGLLYRHPVGFDKELGKLSPGARSQAAFFLQLHFFPYMVVLLILGRLVTFGLLKIPETPLTAANTFYFHAGDVTRWVVLWMIVGATDAIFGQIAHRVIRTIGYGIVNGTVFGILWGLAGVVYGLMIGLIFGLFTPRPTERIASWIVFGTILGFTTAEGFTFWVCFLVGFAITYSIGAEIEGRTPGRRIMLGPILGYLTVMGPKLAGAESANISSGIVVAAVATFFIVRLYNYVFHPFFLLPRPHGRWYPYHPVAWDRVCVLPFPGLHHLLVAYAAQAPQAGMQEIERLIAEYPSQRSAALRAKAMLPASATAVQL
jgi:hypothetical protein